MLSKKVFKLSVTAVQDSMTTFVWNHWIFLSRTTQTTQTEHNVFLTLTTRALYLNLTKPWAQRRHNTKLEHLSFSVWNAIFSDLCLFYLHNLVQLMCMIFRLLVTMKIYAYLPKDSDFYCCHCTCNFNTIKNSRYNCSGWRASCQARMTLHHFSQKAVF